MSKFDSEELKNLEAIINVLRDNLPKKAPILFGKGAVDSSRALFIREACYHRITELAESAYDDFNKNRLIAAFIMARSIKEAESLFFKYVGMLEGSLESKNIQDIRDFFTKVLLGVKASKAKEAGFSHNPIHALDLIRGMDKKVSGYFNHKV